MKITHSINLKSITIISLLIFIIFIFNYKNKKEYNYVIKNFDINACLAEKYAPKGDMIYKSKLISQLKRLTIKENKLKVIYIHLGNHLSVKNPLVTISKSDEDFYRVYENLCLI